MPIDIDHQWLIAQMEALLKQQAVANQQQQSLYLARGGYMQMNGNDSAGILKGMVHYMPRAEQWLRAQA